MSSGRSNIVMVTFDSLRGDHCGFLSDDHGLTPTMDALADEGVSFTNAIAPGPQTFSSMPTVFTGRPRPPTTLERYPQDSHWERRLAAIGEHLRRYPSLPERLNELGYDTAGVSPNPWTSGASGFDRGFEYFLDLSDGANEGWSHTLAERLPGIDADSRPVALVLNMLSGSEFFCQWETFYDRILRIREGLSEPYFLWIFALDTHFPFITSRTHRQEQSLFGAYSSAYRSSEPMRGNRAEMSESVRESVKRSYRDTVRASDAFIDQLRSDFDADDPVLIVHSDHGESFGEHGNYGHHHRQVYEENIHVPYFIHNASTNKDVGAPTSLATVYDATLAIARDGFSDIDFADDTYAIAASECGRERTVRGSRFKYIKQRDGRLLFDLECDPDERTDLSDERPDLCRELQRKLDRRDRHLSETNRLHRATREIASFGTL